MTQLVMYGYSLPSIQSGLWDSSDAKFSLRRVGWQEKNSGHYVDGLYRSGHYQG